MNGVLPNLGLLAIALAIAGGASELSLRALFGAPPVWTFPQERYLLDAEMGYLLEPRQRAFTHGQLVEINHMGLRDRDYPRVPAADVRRLLALGDSQTFGNGLALADTWPKQLERELRQKEGRVWEVINAGVPGSDTWQHAILLRRICSAYASNGLVLGFYVNDVVPVPVRPQISEGELASNWFKRAAYVLKRSALFSATWQARHPIRAWLAGDRASWEEMILTGEADPRIEAGWLQVERSLTEMKHLADDRNLTFWVVALPRRDQVTGAQPGRAYQRRIADITAKLGIRLFDALPVLEAKHSESADQLFIPWDGHNSSVSNAAIARELARLMIEAD